MKHKLVVIEDDPDIQDLIVGFFRPRGYEIKTFDTAEKALEKLRADPKLGEVILVDLRLPRMSGLDLTRILVAENILAPLILMTANRTSEMAIEAIQAGAYDFVVKPLHFPQLQVSVERALHLNKIRAENATLKQFVASNSGNPMDGIIGRSPKFLQALDLAKRVAKSNSNVFISGESGSGKEVVAKAIHQFSNRCKEPFVAINCSAIPENLLESELFGHAKGAFTGAGERKIGLFEEANGGTLFLDEIGDLTLPLQAKVLRAIQERKVKRIGENQDRDIDIRIISATHRNLRQEIAVKQFREDLFYRLNVIPIRIPPLRDRHEDILPLAEFFLRKYAALNESRVLGFSKEVVELLFKNPWTGNVRELENMIERAVVLCGGNKITKDDLIVESNHEPCDAGPPPGHDGDFVISKERILPLEEVVNRYISFALNLNEGAKDRTARELSIDRKTLYRHLQDFTNSTTH